MPNLITLRDVMNMIWGYLHPNQRFFFEGRKLLNYDDLSEDQLLYMPNPDHGLLFPQCVELQCIGPLERIQWTHDLLRVLIGKCHESKFCEPLMNYVLGLLARAEPRQRYEYKPHLLFPTGDVSCLQACQWYRAHGLWDGSSAIHNAIRFDNVEWFTHETKGHEMKYVEDVLYGCLRCKINILVWIASNHDLSDQVNDLFNSHQLNVEDMKRLYVAMKLDKTQVLEIIVEQELDWYRFVLDHFTIENPQTIIMDTKNWPPGILFMMHFEWDIPSNWDFAIYGKGLDVQDLEKLYAYAPQVFMTDLTSYKWCLPQLRFAIEHGAYVTKPLVCVTRLLFAKKEDYLLDTRLPEKVVLDYIDTLHFQQRTLNDECRLWLAHTCTRMLPHGHERFHFIFMQGVFNNACQWTEYMTLVADYVNWETIDIEKIIDQMPKCVDKLIGRINMSTVLKVAMKHGCRSIKYIIKACSQRKISLQLDTETVKQYWCCIPQKQRRALLHMFPNQCPEKPSQEFASVQHLTKRQKKNF